MGANYSEAEVARMVMYYANLQAVADVNRKGLRFLVLAADLERAMSYLDDKHYAVLLLVGILGIPQHVAAELLQTSQRSVSRRYAEALEDVHYWINGGQ